MDMKTELRWLVKEDSRVLQYRREVSGTDYAAVDSNGNHVKTTYWSDWQDVPEESINVK
jgi:hypothetical protein